MPEHANDRNPGDRDPGDRGPGARQMRPDEEVAFAQRISALGDRLGRAAKRRGLIRGGAQDRDTGNRDTGNRDTRDGNGSHDRRQGGTDEDVGRDPTLAGRGMAYGMRMATELVAAVVVGGGLGVGLDKWLGTWPWLFLLFFILGFAAGVLNVARGYATIASQIAASSARRTVGDDG